MTETEQERRQGAAADPQAGQETAGKCTVMGLVGLGVFMATLDASIVNISLPKISQSFHAPLNGLVEWVIIAYLIVIGSLLLILGRISDLVGQKLLWASGLTVFTLSSILWRLVVTGLGQGIFQPPNNNAIMGAVPKHRVGIAAGFLATVRVLGQASSVALSGAVFAMFGGTQAGMALLKHAGAQAGHFEATFVQAFGMAMRTCMAVASLGVLTSLMRGQSH